MRLINNVLTRENHRLVSNQILDNIMLYNNDDIVTNSINEHRVMFTIFVSTYILNRYDNRPITKSIIADVLDVVITLAITLIATH